MRIFTPWGGHINFGEKKMPYLKKDSKNKIIAVYTLQQTDDQGKSLNLEFVKELPKEWIDAENNLQQLKNLQDQLGIDDYKVVRHTEEQIAKSETTLTAKEFEALSTKRTKIRQQIKELRNKL